MAKDITHSVVIPVYGNSGSIDQLIESLIDLANPSHGKALMRSIGVSVR